MHTLLTRFLDVLFPPSADARIVRSIDAEDMRLLYHPMTVRGVRVLSEFRNPRIRALIHETKFHNSAQAPHLLAQLLERYLDTCTETYDHTIPIPLSSARLRARGYNQVERVLIHTHATAPITTNVLKRTRHTRPQTELKKKARETNIKGAFTVIRPEMIAGKHILLVDDVLTTGATLHEAKSVLLQHGAKRVSCLAFAH